ncbi:hypothetical protein [Shouchella lehensis]|uniref:hypothetical protein n=1 Tax=Shouchella lehensis TaxID=300825 RepID=UPI001419B469|nr:hypothetical protein [Shouchella lehensis]
MKPDWYTYAITIATMTFVGFTSFNNTAAALIFGIGSGSIFGWVIASILKIKQ